MNIRSGDWIQTYTGNQFWPLDPRPEEVNIIDIAHALSNICRYAGHCKKFYSVAQHSVLVSLYCNREDSLAGLLHDATEAYIVDVPRPVKHDEQMRPYRKIESHLEKVIFSAFGLSVPIPASVKRADDSLLMTERRDLMATPPIPWSPCHEEPVSEIIEPWSPEMAEEIFLNRYYELI